MNKNDKVWSYSFRLFKIICWNMLQASSYNVSAYPFNQHMTNLEFWSTTIVRNAKNNLDHFNIELSCPILLQYNFQSDHHNSKSSTFITPRQANSQLPATPKQKGFTLESPNGCNIVFLVPWFWMDILLSFESKPIYHIQIYIQCVGPFASLRF